MKKSFRLATPDAVQKRWPTLINVMVGRLFLFALLLLVQFLFLPLDQQNRLPLFLFLGGAFTITIPYVIWLRREETARISGPAQFVIDVLIITGLIHFTGGRNSDLILLYPLVILVAGIVFSGKMAAEVAIFSGLMYALMILLEGQGYLEYLGPPPNPYLDARYMLLDIVQKTCIFGFFTVAAMFITNLCLVQRTRLDRLRSVGQILFDNVKAPLLGVNRDGAILLANRPARALLVGNDLLPVGTRVTSFFAAPVPHLDELMKESSLRDMQTVNGTRFSALVDVQAAQLPLSDLQASTLFHSDDNQLYVLLFQNVSGIVSGAGDTAASMVAEMAHEVRNPITAIRGAGQLLSDAATSIAQQHHPTTANDWTMINTLCTVISQESERLESRMQELLEQARNNPDQMAETARQAGEWSKRVTLFKPKEHPRDESNPAG